MASFWYIEKVRFNDIDGIYCAGIVATDDLEKAFKDIDAAFMVGSMPRKQGMERKDLLSCNVSIFKAQVST